MSRLCAWGLLAHLAGLCACKVPFVDVEARFEVADVTWFEAEETLFAFYEIQATQGLGPESVVELRYTTDAGVVDWTPVTTLPPVHRHLPVDCGPESRCGSLSLRLPLPPRDVGLRLRYHRDGALSLDAETRLNQVAAGPAHTQRSLLVYGVFDATNRAVQWRARHRFPTLRNAEVERLGLRRRFVIEDQRTTLQAPFDRDNPYGYGAPCAAAAPVDFAVIQTDDRAAFSPEDLPDAALAAAGLCAQATVFDATGPFTAEALARKNPEVRPAFPLLRSPIRDALPLPYLLAPCQRTISAVHRRMQLQRLLIEGTEPFCIDDLSGPALSAALEARIRADLEPARAAGQDLVLVMALHHDDRALPAAVEAALKPILQAEAARNSPRVAGAFLLDSYPSVVQDPVVGAASLWCPSALDEDALLDLIAGGGQAPAGAASLVCALPPEDLRLVLGPFTVGGLPILPSRSQYLSFLQIYSEGESGQMRRLRYRAPERPPGAEHVPVPPFGTATFFNDETVGAPPGSAFSFCPSDEYPGVVFRSAFADDPMPIATLPAWHQVIREPRYSLGLVWEFPYRLDLEYVLVGAVAFDAVVTSLPLGLGFEQTDSYGSALWDTGEFPLRQSLLQCDRHCGHPTFDAAGIYQVRDSFRRTYATACYAPRFPDRGDSGFPRDP